MPVSNDHRSSQKVVRIMSEIMQVDLLGLGIAVGLIFIILVGLLTLVARFYRKVDQGRALIVNTMRQEPIVTFTGRTVFPIIHRAEEMDISVKTIEIDRRGKDGLICKDNIRADIKVTFFVRVNKTTEDVMKVAQAIGCARASDQDTLETIFVAKFSEGLKTVGKRLEFEELYSKRDEFRDAIIDVIGKDLNGFILDDAAIDYLEQTSLAALDPSNILDAQGIRKITELTAAQNVRTNDLKQEERKAIRKKDVEAEEAILELDRQAADAAAKQQREIAVIVAREAAETLRVQAEERKKAELARLKQEEDVQVQEQSKLRQIEIAQKGRERVVAVENERVEKDRALEAIAREREVELQRIDKEKALEVERKAIAEVVAGRVSVEKGVAEEEERIKDVRVVADAKRKKEAKVIGAEAEAQEKLVVQIKSAEASEQVARHKAKEELVIAEAKLEASDRLARAKIREADGAQAEYAAQGLAAAKVKEADALAVEKLGSAEARIALEKAQAEAKGEEETGMARIRVREAEAHAIERQGAAEATATKDMLVAQAAGEESKGLAAAKIKEADAAATEKLAVAEAAGIKERMSAEASGLSEKAKALQALSGEARAHEEYRLQLEQQLQLEKERLAARRDIASDQAQVMATAMGQAKINIVGGDGSFLNQFFKAVSLGQAVDGAVGSSELLTSATDDYKSGAASLRQDVKDVLSGAALNSESLKNLSIVAALNHVMQASGPEQQSKLTQLIEHARSLGLK